MSNDCPVDTHDAQRIKYLCLDTKCQHSNKIGNFHSYLLRLCRLLPRKSHLSQRPVPPTHLDQQVPNWTRRKGRAGQQRANRTHTPRYPNSRLGILTVSAAAYLSSSLLQGLAPVRDFRRRPGIRRLAQKVQRRIQRNRQSPRGVQGHQHRHTGSPAHQAGHRVLSEFRPSLR